MTANYILFIGFILLVLTFVFFTSSKLKLKKQLGTILIVAAFTLSLCLIITPRNLWQLAQGKIPLKEAVNLTGGIDITGGTTFVLEVQKNKNKAGEFIDVPPEAMEKIRTILAKRVNQFGVSDIPIRIIGDNRIEISIPNVTPQNAQAIEEVLQKVSKLTIHKTHPKSSQLVAKIKDGKIPEKLNNDLTLSGYSIFPYQKKTKEGKEKTSFVVVTTEPALTGEYIKFAEPDYRTGSSVAITLTDEGGKKMGKFTQSLIKGRDHIATVLDGEVIVNAVLNANKLGKYFVIDGQKNLQESRSLAQNLMNPLSHPLRILHKTSKSPTLGKAAVEQGIKAGILGLILTAIFMVLYYRLAGIITLVGLIINMLIVFGAMALVGASFTLPGIAGIILTIGLAVDANVLIYERLREEMQSGKKFKVAFQTAYEKAFSAILDANITTLFTAIILFVKASGSIQGFSVTLIIGILGTLFSALVCTRVLFWWRGNSTKLDTMTFVTIKAKKIIPFLNWRKKAFSLSIILIGIGIIATGIRGKSGFGVDFTGGNLLRFENLPAQLSQQLDQKVIKQALQKAALKNSYQLEIEQPLNSSKIISVYTANTTGDLGKIELTIRNLYPELQAKDQQGNWIITPNIDTVSPSMGKEFINNSLWAIIIAIFIILLYIALRFEFSFAVGAFFALLHDIIIVFGLLMLFGNQQITQIHIGAFLTIAGYSINDTIVVFDRIREKIKQGGKNLTFIINDAITSTLSRTILTSVTTLISLVCLWIIGGPALKGFSITVIIGIIVGTYSSIFIASSLVYILSGKDKAEKLRKEMINNNHDETIA